jgi:hypothetical protein
MNILLAPINDFICTNLYLFIMYDYPCAHVLKVTNKLTLEMIKVQHWKPYATHYNDDDYSLGIGLELKNYNFDTAIMKEWVYLYQGKFSLDLKDQVMMIRFLTFMMEQ